MNLPKIAVERPVAVTMAILLMIFMGVIGLTQLPLELMPDLDLPVIVVIAEFPGAGPSEVEDLVVEPLEETLQAVSDVSSITAISQEGEAQIIMEFEWGTDLDFAIQDVREQIDLVMDLLPDDAEDPFALQFDPTEMPVLEFAVSGEGELHEVRRNLDNDVVPQLERVSGVAEVDILGGQERQIQVELLPDRVRRHNIAVFDVMESVYAANLDIPGGDVTLDGSEELLVRTLGSFESLAEIGDVPVPGGAGGFYYLDDVAHIQDGFTDQDIIVRQNGEEGLGLTISQEADANTVETVEQVNDQLESLQQELDYDLNFTTIMDEAEYIEVAIQTVVNNAVVGGILAVIILFLFLNSVSTTIIVAVTIPVAITATFFLIFQAGLDLNMMTLGGLALGTGMLVDNSVVVTENIFRMREDGKEIKPAAIEGAVEVGVPIAASTFTTMAVFLPVVFIEGIAGEIFQDLSFTVAFSLLLSLVVALTLIPMLSLRLLARTDLKKVRKRQRESRVNRALESLKKQYDRLIKFLLRHRLAAVIVILIIFGTTLAVAGMMGQEFLPDLDEGMIDVRLEMPPGTPLRETEERVARLESEIEQWPEVDNIQSEVGYGGISSEARITVVLVDLADRDRDTTELVQEARALADIVPEAELEASNLSLVTGGDIDGAPIAIELLGADRDQLEEVGEDLEQIIADIDITTEVDLAVDEPRPELQIDVDRRQAGNYGLSGAEIGEAVNAAIDGEVVTRFEDEAQDGEIEQVDVLLRYGGGTREDLSRLESMPVANARGQVIPLDQVADISRGLSPVELTRLDQTNSVTIYSDHVDSDLGTAVDAVEEELEAYNLPADIDYEFGSDTEWMRDAFDDLFFALMLAIVIVFMLLAAQFESYWQPLVIILSVPFGLVGVVFGLLITGRSLNVASYIGVIMMVGIVVNNAIVLLDYINRQVAKGGPREEAISRASQIRLRPILMTTLTTVLAMFPLSLGIGEGAEIQAPIATAVIGGLLVSTASTMIVLPTLYTLFADLAQKISGKES